MKKTYLHIVISYLFAFIAVACSSGGDDNSMGTPDIPVTPPASKPLPISLNVGVTPSTKVSDTAFENNDAIGVYVVNYQGQTPGNLTATGNHVDNMKFTFNGTWAPQSPIYWKDNVTPADFYAYYPFASVTNVTAHPFTVKADQSSLANYKASEFMYGKAAKAMPSNATVNIQAQHLMSCMVVKVAPGNGFTAESLKTANVSIQLNGQRHQATINLKNGTIEATGAAAATIPYKEGEIYKALVVPQSVTAADFIAVTVNNHVYKLNKSFTFVSGKRHQFTVTVSKTSNGINVGVTPWEDDNVDHGGTAE